MSWLSLPFAFVNNSAIAHWGAVLGHYLRLLELFVWAILKLSLWPLFVRSSASIWCSLFTSEIKFRRSQLVCGRHERTSSRRAIRRVIMIICFCPSGTDCSFNSANCRLPIEISVNMLKCRFTSADPRRCCNNSCCCPLIAGQRGSRGTAKEMRSPQVPPFQLKLLLSRLCEVNIVTFGGRLLLAAVCVIICVGLSQDRTHVSRETAPIILPHNASRPCEGCGACPAASL